MGFEQSVYQNLVKKKMGLNEVSLRIWLKKNVFWTKCVLEFGKKQDGL